MNEQNTIKEASKVIQDIQMKAILTSPMWMRLNWMCNSINSLIKNGRTESDIDWNKVNEILTTHVNEYDFNFFKRIETIEQLVWTASSCQAASICGEEFWQEHKCKDCGEWFVMTYNEVEFYRNKELHIPKRCKACRSKRKASKM